MKQTQAAERLLQAVRREMQSQSLSALIVPTSDPHNSEYVADRDQHRARLTNFYGSAGTALVTADEALLWTDGRYWLEAAASLPEGWQLQKSGMNGVPSLEDWLENRKREVEEEGGAEGVAAAGGNTTAAGSKFTVGVDAYTYDVKSWEALGKRVGLKASRIAATTAAAQQHLPAATAAAEERGGVPAAVENKYMSKVFVRLPQYCGETPTEKLARVYEKACRLSSPTATSPPIDAILLTALDDIAWLTNMRGSGDVPYNPVFISYLVIDFEKREKEGGNAKGGGDDMSEGGKGETVKSPTATMHLFVDYDPTFEVSFDGQGGATAVKEGGGGGGGVRSPRPTVAEHCAAHNIVLHPYDDIETFLVGRYHRRVHVSSSGTAAAAAIVGIEESQTNFALKEVLETPQPQEEGKESELSRHSTTPAKTRRIPSIVKDLKGVKTAVELQGMEDCHIRDGCALVRFMAWLTDAMTTDAANNDGGMVQQRGPTRDGCAADNSNNGGDAAAAPAEELKPIRETTCCDKLEWFRAQEALFRGPSFATISSSGPNGAVIHYHPRKTDPPSDRVLKHDELYLVDSGGQYEDGTTDVTRVLTFSPSTTPQCVKIAYTLVLKGHIALATAVFPQGVAGYRLDCLARQFLWQEGLDYQHGTGHGVGSFLCVHEGPHSVPSRLPATAVPLVEGMIVSNEPGYYEDGAYGIRIENLVSVVKADSSKMQYPSGSTKATGGAAPCASLAFKQLTMCPFNKDLIECGLLTAPEIKFVDEYHLQVRNALKPLLEAHNDRVALAYLMEHTQPLHF